MIRAPSEMRCSAMPIRLMTRKVTASTTGMVIATTSPARSPRLIKLTIKTIATASSSALVKLEIASRTTCGWSDTRCAVTPAGKAFCSRSISASSALPKLKRLPPARMPMASPMAGLPSNRNNDAGGSA